ncbi:MAG: hypothetical protein J6R50_04810 [Alistipes sp.]|nr:hypothetical protein [Alistipes sp.]MBO7282695.1 hypothetical protein [Alistipes sp.]
MGIGGNYKINEYGEIIKDSEIPNDLAGYENALLRGERLKANIRRKVAKETHNEKVLWICIRDTAITVVAAAKENPTLTPEMKIAISKKENECEQLKQYKTQEEMKKLEEIEKSSKGDSENKGCLWFIIITCALGALISYLSGEMWFPF